MRRVSCFERSGEMVRSYKRRRLLSGVGGRWTKCIHAEGGVVID